MDWAIRSQAPKPVMTRVWRRFRDYMEVGQRSLVNSSDGLRYSPATWETLWSNRGLQQLSSLNPNV